MHLSSLYQASPTLLPKPYHSKSLYLPPILMGALRPFFKGATAEQSHISTSVIWSLADVLSAFFLADIYNRKRKYISKTHRGQHTTSSAMTNIDLNIGSLTGSKGLIAAMYMFNPYTLGSCLARSTTSISSLLVLAAVDASMAGE